MYPTPLTGPWDCCEITEDLCKMTEMTKLIFQQRDLAGQRLVSRGGPYAASEVRGGSMKDFKNRL